MKWTAGPFVLLPFVVGCTTTSTIYRADQSEFEAKILGGSPSALLIEVDGRRYALPRNEVTEIDHPGTAHAVVGGVQLGYGVPAILMGMKQCQQGVGNTDADQRAFCVALFTPAAIGLGMLIWGLVVNAGAKKAERDQSLKIEAPPSYLPAATPPPATTPPPASTSPTTDTAKPKSGPRRPTGKFPLNR